LAKDLLWAMPKPKKDLQDSQDSQDPGLASTLRRMLQTSAQDDVPGYARIKH